MNETTFSNISSTVLKTSVKKRKTELKKKSKKLVGTTKYLSKSKMRSILIKKSK